jgi:hypothetical protein
MNTLNKVRDAVVDKASDATVGVGHRLLNRILGREESRQVIEGAVIDVAAGEQGGETATRSWTTSRRRWPPVRMA